MESSLQHDWTETNLPCERWDKSISQCCQSRYVTISTMHVCWLDGDLAHLIVSSLIAQRITRSRQQYVSTWEPHTGLFSDTGFCIMGRNYCPPLLFCLNALAISVCKQHRSTAPSLCIRVIYNSALSTPRLCLTPSSIVQIESTEPPEVYEFCHTQGWGIVSNTQLRWYVWFEGKEMTSLLFPESSSFPSDTFCPSFISFHLSLSFKDVSVS